MKVRRNPEAHEPRGRRLGAKTALLGSVAAAMVAAGFFVPASASPVTGAATGTTTLTLGGKAYNTLQGSGCGLLGVTSANGVQYTVITKGLRLSFPISGYEVQPSNDDAFRLDHTGSVTLDNTCYSITLGGLRVTNFGLANQGSTFDISAVTKSADDSGRQVIGTLDLSGAQITWTGNTVRVSQMKLLTAAEGAQELNELAVGGDGSTGPFVTGQQIGSARTRVTFLF